MALLGIGAVQGRRAGAAFLLGHLVGDILWSALALSAIIGAREIGSGIFDALGIVCGVYLAILGIKAIRVRKTTDGQPIQMVPRPLLRGLVFGATNPKAYPVAVATFTALLADYASQLSWASLPGLLLAAGFGFLVADCILVGLISTSSVRRFYRRHELWIVRASGVVFLGFSAAALQAAAPNLLRLRR